MMKSWSSVYRFLLCKGGWEGELCGRYALLLIPADTDTVEEHATVLYTALFSYGR